MKVLMIGDSPFGSTGFGRTNSHALQAFLDAGLEVGIVTALQTKSHPPRTDLPVSLFVPEDYDEMGMYETIRVLDEFKPDVVYGTGDPGNVGGFAAVIPDRTPSVWYVPIEGSPIVHTAWRTLLSYINFFTCSEFGAQAVKASVGRDVDYIYHGVDTDIFNPLSDEERSMYRRRLGWDEKFVVTCVAQNVRRKQLPRLIEAISILKHVYHQKDILLYLHTVPFQGHWLEGWELSEIARSYDVYDEVVFNPLMGTRFASIPDRGDIEVPGIRELVGSGNLFVLPSQVEGFGLPTLEAIACGSPVAVTKYAAGWEIANKAIGVGIVPHDWEIHKSGSRYANVDPLDMAKSILSLKRNPKQLARMSAAGLNALPEFQWSTFKQYVAQRVIDAGSATNIKPAVQGQADPSTLEAASDHLRQSQRHSGSTTESNSPRIEGS